MITNNKPAIGMGCTIYDYTDRRPATIIDILHDGKKILIQEDNCTRTDNNGFSEVQEYAYTPNPAGDTYTATRRKDGEYRLVGTQTLVSLGERRRYYDYSF